MGTTMNARATTMARMPYPAPVWLRCGFITRALFLRVAYSGIESMLRVVVGEMDRCTSRDDREARKGSTFYLVVIPPLVTNRGTAGCFCNAILGFPLHANKRAAGNGEAFELEYCLTHNG